MPDRIADHYERHAHAFDTVRRQQFVERHWLDRFLLGVAKGGHVLDLGCGAAEPIARYVIDSGHPLTGVDGSARMIALARTRFGRQTWLHADMRSVAIGGTFAGVLAWDSMFHLPHEDHQRMIGKIAGWLQPGGMLLFNSGPARGEAIGDQFGEALYHASLDPWEYRALFQEYGLTENAYAPEDPATGGRTVWLVRKFA